MSKFSNEMRERVMELRAEENSLVDPFAPLKLHLGCGDRRLAGFVHIDSRDLPGLDHVRQVQNLTIYEDNSVDLIYASHVFEHIERPFQVDVLKHWRAKLKPGGTLRLAVPDFDKLTFLYVEKSVSFWRLVGPLYGRQNYPANTHFCGFDHEYLSWLLTEAGFYHIRRWYPEIVLPRDFDDYSFAEIDEKRISLCLEATA